MRMVFLVAATAASRASASSLRKTRASCRSSTQSPVLDRYTVAPLISSLPVRMSTSRHLECLFGQLRGFGPIAMRHRVADENHCRAFCHLGPIHRDLAQSGAIQ